MLLCGDGKAMEKRMLLQVVFAAEGGPGVDVGAGDVETGDELIMETMQTTKWSRRCRLMTGTKDSFKDATITHTVMVSYCR